MFYSINYTIMKSKHKRVLWVKVIKGFFNLIEDLFDLLT